MTVVNQVKGTEFVFSLFSNLAVNINEGYCLLSQPMKVISENSNEVCSVYKHVSTIKLTQIISHMILHR